MNSQKSKPTSFSKRFETLKAGITSSKQGIDEKMFLVVFENIAKILAPIVQYFDKPLNTQTPFVHNGKRLGITKERALVVFDGYGVGTFSIALTRSGKWFYADSYDEPPIAMDTHAIASKIFSKRMLLAREASYERIPKDGQLHFMKNLFIHAGLLSFLNGVHVTIQKCIDEREEKLCLMREELKLFDDFCSALDPIVSSGNSVDIVGYSIFWEGNHGTSRITADYLDGSITQGKLIDPRKKLFTSTVESNRLCDYANRVVYIATSVDQNIIHHEERDRRPTLTDSEIKILQEQVRLIYK